EGILAFYDSDRERIIVRGTEMTVGVRVTLVHELTHALQDQHFGLSLIDDLGTAGEIFAWRAVVEGDATRIENTYLASLPGAEQDRYEAELARQHGRLDIPGVPGVLVALSAAPYLLGEAFVAAVEAAAGPQGIDAALLDPPRSENDILDPWAWLDAREARPSQVVPPRLGTGERRLEVGEIGALSWYLALAERIDPNVALTAVEGWSGDAFVYYRQGSRSCLRAAYQGATARENDEMAAALAAWARAMPAEADVRVRRAGANVELTSCDPGPAASLNLSGKSTELLGLPVARTYLTAAAVEAGSPLEVAQCIAYRLVVGYSLEQLREGSFLGTADFERRRSQVATSCRR
ncbi:MAG: hypothetical protein ACRD0D_08035, partial [Acidimicrobiales bacterium]